MSRGGYAGLLGFAGVAFAWSWGVWLGGPVLLAAIAPDGPESVVTLVGAFGPSIAGLLVVGWTGGSGAVRALLGRLFRWRVAPRWYLVALLTPAAISLAASGIAVVLGAAPPVFDTPPIATMAGNALPETPLGPWVLLPVVVVQTLLVGSPIAEEFGWRGYLLPWLLDRTTPLLASIGVGVVWGVWHLPLVVGWSGATVDTPLAAFMLGITGDAVLFTWLYLHTDRSILLAVLFHAAIAVTGLFLASAAGSPFLDPALTWVVVAAIVAVHGRYLADSPGRPHPAN